MKTGDVDDVRPDRLSYCRPNRKGPMNSQIAAIRRAFLEERAPVVIIVATTLAAS